MAKKKEKEPDRILLPGKPDYEQVDNKVVSARYTLITFFPMVSLAITRGPIVALRSGCERTVSVSLVEPLRCECPPLSVDASLTCFAFELFPIGDHSTIPSICQSVLFDCGSDHGDWLVYRGV